MLRTLSRAALILGLAIAPGCKSPTSQSPALAKMASSSARPATIIGPAYILGDDFSAESKARIYEAASAFASLPPMPPPQPPGIYLEFDRSAFPYPHLQIVQPGKLMASTNLTSWEQIGEIVQDDLPVLLIDASGARARFYILRN